MGDPGRPVLIQGPGGIVQDYQRQFLLNVTGGGLSPTWYNSGTTAIVTVPGVFNRTAGIGQRVTSYSIDGKMSVHITPTAQEILVSVPMQTSHNLSISSVEQYEVRLDSTTAAALASITPPTVPGDNYWYDTGANVSVALDGVWGREEGTGSRLVSYSLNDGSPDRVDTAGAVTAFSAGSISIPINLTSTYVPQYSLSVASGSIVNETAPSIPGDAGWYDSGTNVSATFDLSSSVIAGQSRMESVAYTLNGEEVFLPKGSNSSNFTVRVTMSAPETVSVEYVLQYHVAFLFTDHSGSIAIAPSGFQADVNGNVENLSMSDSWFSPGTSINVTRVVWNGAALTPAGSAQVLVTGPETLKVQTSLYEASLKVTDILGLPVSGAQVAVPLEGGTTATAVTAGDGVASLGLVPAGTYHARVDNMGITTTVLMNPALEAQTTASVPLSYALLGMILLVVAAPAVAYYLGLRRGRRFRDASPRSLGNVDYDAYARDQAKEESLVQFQNVGCKISGKTILRDITLDVERGEIIGILGRNGAGKTTLLSLISGLRSPSSGRVVVLGEQLPARGTAYRRRMGFVLQEDALYQESTVLENLRFSADLYDVRDAQKRIDEVLELLGLTDRRNQVVGTLSGGLKRRTAIARAFLHDPDLFIVDEPTLGVDADARHAVWAYLRLLRSRRRTVIVATNYLDEALALCDRVAVLAEGTLLTVEEPRELVRRTGSCIDIDCDQSVAMSIASGATGLVQVIRAEVTLSGISLFLDKGADPDEVLRRFASVGRIEGFRLRAPDLSEIFKSLGR